MATNPSAFTSPGPLAAMGQRAATALAGFALQNGTPTILTYTTPSDGVMHRFQVLGDLVVTSAETGGAVSITFTDPASVVRTVGVWNGGLGTGFTGAGSIGPNMFTVAPGTAVSLVQGTALTVGAASVYAELWGS